MDTSQEREQPREWDEHLAIGKKFMAHHSESWQEGFDDGYAWYMDAKDMDAIQQAAGFGIPNKPHRFDDDEYNVGVADGIEEARSQS